MLTYGGVTEIYNEAIRDLLVSDKEAEGKQYTMRTGTQFTGFTGATVQILMRELEQATAALAAC
jgi:hypothetical protein